MKFEELFAKCQEERKDGLVKKMDSFLRIFVSHWSSQTLEATLEAIALVV